MATLDEIRSRIDDLNRVLLESLNQRAELAIEAGRIKQEQGLPVFDPPREQEILADLEQLNQGPLSGRAVSRVFAEIISACRAVQSPILVSYLGPEGTFSHQAAADWFGRSAGLLARSSISDVFREAESGRADYAVVPVENSTEGTVGLTLDHLIDSKLKICGETYLSISHALMSTETEVDRIETVLSHPQALAQCRGWLAGNLPGRGLVETASTAEAARRATSEPGTAAVGSALLAELMGLTILSSDIQDQPLNLTRFLVLGRADGRPTGHDKTSIMFTAAHKPGSLYDSLKPLSVSGVNLTRIESRPAGKTPWEYVFFIDFEGHAQDPEVKNALTYLDKGVEQLKILGSYQMGRGNGVMPEAELV